MDQKAEDFLKESGILDNLNEEAIKDFFAETFGKFKEGELDAKTTAKIFDELLYQHIYDMEVKIKDSGLISALELASEIDEVDPESSDYELVMAPINDYLFSYEANP